MKKTIPEFTCGAKHYYAAEEVNRRNLALCPHCQRPLRVLSSMDRRIWKINNDPEIKAARDAVPIIRSVPADSISEPDLTIPPYGQL